MQKSVLLRALQQEIRRHDFNYSVHEAPSIAQGGKGVVVPGCPACMKSNQYDEPISRSSCGRCVTGSD